MLSACLGLRTEPNSLMSTNDHGTPSFFPGSPHHSTSIAGLLTQTHCLLYVPESLVPAVAFANHPLSLAARKAHLIYVRDL